MISTKEEINPAVENGDCQHFPHNPPAVSYGFLVPILSIPAPHIYPADRVIFASKKAAALQLPPWYSSCAGHHTTPEEINLALERCWDIKRPQTGILLWLSFRRPPWPSPMGRSPWLLRCPWCLCPPFLPVRMWPMAIEEETAAGPADPDTDMHTGMNEEADDGEVGPRMAHRRTRSSQQTTPWMKQLTKQPKVCRR